MNINWQQQDLHSAEPKADWVLVQSLERDICLLYHQLAAYSYIMSDLYYGDVFALHYWQWLDMELPDPQKTRFISEGCLVMLLAMAWEVLDGTGSYILRTINESIEAVKNVKPKDAHHARLRDTALEALVSAKAQGLPSEQLEENSRWVHRHFVQGYFQKWVKDFAQNPYYGR